MIRARNPWGWRIALASWLAAVALSCGQQVAALDDPSVRLAGSTRPLAAGGGIAGLVVQVEMLEAGGPAKTQAVEVRWPEGSNASGWWWLIAGPLVLVFAACGQRRRGLRGHARLG